MQNISYFFLGPYKYNCDVELAFDVLAHAAEKALCSRE